MKIKVIDLFCGIGGFSYGFQMAGFNVALGIDMWDTALETFRNNHSETETLNSDITKLGNSLFEKYKGTVDVIIAGPPCQGFSMSGKRDPRDSRNNLFEEVIRVTAVVKPKIVVIENVVGLLSMETANGEPVANVIKRRFEELKMGYVVKYKILNAADYGVPQRRRRVIFVASRVGDINFPEPEFGEEITTEVYGEVTKKWVTVGEAIGNIPNIGALRYLEPAGDYQLLMKSKRGNVIHNHEAINHDELIVKRMASVPQGGNWKDIPEELGQGGGKHSNNYKRLQWDKPSVTIKHASKSMIIHPLYNRCLTVREIARIQSFDDDFIFSGLRTEQYQQLADAVPPLLGYAIAKKVKDYLIKNKRLNITVTENKRSLDRKESFKFIDLFAGIGGFRIAFESCGNKCVFSSEIDKWARETYYQNFGEFPSGDITKIDSADIPEHDVLCAGFPCQAFSIAGMRKGFEDARGTLFFEVARILRDKRPKAFILENVRGIVNHDKGRTLKIIENVLDSVGYDFRYKIMNAVDYGIPQNRERWYCVGFRKDLGIKFKEDFEGLWDSYKFFVFPKKRKLEKRVKEFIGEKYVEGYQISEKARQNIQKYYPEYEANRSKRDGITVANEIRASRCHFRSDGIMPCFTAKMGTGGNNVPVILEYGRKLTEKECLAFMGFPDTFKIRKGSYQSYKQIGNSITVTFVEELAKEITRILRNL
jgi:DNA (cytosine-5)-methyltransferase 1